VTITSAAKQPSPRADSAGAPLDRVLRALNHPVRRRIMRVLVDGPGSATTIAQEIGIDTGVVSYHLSQVLARECDIVELFDSVPRRGAVEKFYRLKLHALSEADPSEEGAAAPATRRMSFEECLIVAVSAVDADAFAALEGSAWDWSLTQVDEVAWREIRAASDEFDARVRKAAAASRKRTGAEAAQGIVVGVAAVPTVPPPPPAS
jgi:DNA-binding transcriptional ArsR family regulator